MIPQPRHTVLVVDDDADIRAAVESHLCDRGFRVLVAADGAQALQVIESDHYLDLLLSDFVMPAANGRSVVKFAQFVRPEIKVILMSGQPRNQIPPELQSRLLSKPFAMDELDELVDSALG